MQRHLEDSTLQIAGSASLFYIIRKVSMNRDTKRMVVTALLDGMDAHMEEQVTWLGFFLIFNLNEQSIGVLWYLEISND